MKIKKGDLVVVTTGKEKGKTGTVVRAYPLMQKVVIEGLNMMKRHSKPTKAGAKGGIVEKAMPIHVSNVKLAGAESATPKKVAKKAPAKKTAKKTATKTADAE